MNITVRKNLKATPAPARVNSYLTLLSPTLYSCSTCAHHLPSYLVSNKSLKYTTPVHRGGTGSPDFHGPPLERRHACTPQVVLRIRVGSRSATVGRCMVDFMSVYYCMDGTLCGIRD